MTILSVDSSKKTVKLKVEINGKEYQEDISPENLTEVEIFRASTRALKAIENRKKKIIN